MIYNQLVSFFIYNFDDISHCLKYNISRPLAFPLATCQKVHIFLGMDAKDCTICWFVNIFYDFAPNSEEFFFNFILAVEILALLYTFHGQISIQIYRLVYVMVTIQVKQLQYCVSFPLSS